MGETRQAVAMITGGSQGIGAASSLGTGGEAGRSWRLHIDGGQIAGH
jgi:hypothetical protein